MRYQSILIFSISFLLISCNPEKVIKVNFDRKGMLENIGSNLILPAFDELKQSVHILEGQTNLFVTDPNSASLVLLKEKFKNAYINWQKCSVYGFGPADAVQLGMAVNTFPTKPVKISDNISIGTYNLAEAVNFEAKGFPAIDFLLFNDTDENVLASFVALDNAANRKKYLSDVVQDIHDNVDYVQGKWKNEYYQTFITLEGNSVTSALSMLANYINLDWESIKNKKIGWPLGKGSLNNTIFPKTVEAYYSGISLELIKVQRQAIEDLYLGKNAKGDGLGFEDYLIALNAQKGSISLDEAIKNQLASGKNALELIIGSLSDAIVTNPESVDRAYMEFQKQVILFKTDMMSALSVSISYTDTDND